MMLDLLDFLIRINVDAREGFGEDNWCHAVGEDVGLIAAFDGCGGSGSRQHDYYSGHTEAYMASRMCAGAFYDAFMDSIAPKSEAPDAAQIIERFKAYCQTTFQAYRPPSQQRGGLRSSMISTLPTTAAAVLFREKGKMIETDAVWAGDSRVYALLPQGLAQLSLDDTDDRDPYETDSIMTNNVNADRPLQINRQQVEFTKPVVLLAATDGCFAYYRTPMEFEGILLLTLLESDSPAQWEQKLTEQIGEVAGDDYTLVLASLGFGSFDHMKRVFYQRYTGLFKQYLSALNDPGADDALRKTLWERYQPEFTKYLRGL